MFKSKLVRKITYGYGCVLLIIFSFIWIIPNLSVVFLLVMLALIVSWLITIQLIYAFYLFKLDQKDYKERTTLCENCQKTIYKTDLMCPYCKHRTK